MAETKGLTEYLPVSNRLLKELAMGRHGGVVRKQHIAALEDSFMEHASPVDIRSNALNFNNKLVNGRGDQIGKTHPAICAQRVTAAMEWTWQGHDRRSTRKSIIQRIGSAPIVDGVENNVRVADDMKIVGARPSWQKNNARCDVGNHPREPLSQLLSNRRVGVFNHCGVAS